MPVFIVQYLLPGILLGSSVYTDLKSKKVFNKMLLGFLPIILIARFLESGMDGVLVGFIASFAALVLCLPLVLLKAVGSGDLKLLLVLGFTTVIESMFWIVVYSFFWGLILGVTKVLLDKEGRKLLQNTADILSRKKPEVKKLHSIPFTVAILLGWMTLTVLKGI